MERQSSTTNPLAPKAPRKTQNRGPNDLLEARLQRGMASQVRVAPEHRDEPEITQPQPSTTKKPKPKLFGWLRKKLTGRKKKNDQAEVTTQDFGDATPSIWDTTQGIGEARSAYTFVPKMTTTIWADPPPDQMASRSFWDKIRCR